MRTTVLASLTVFVFACGGSSGPADDYRQSFNDLKAAGVAACSCNSDPTGCEAQLNAELPTDTQLDCAEGVINDYSDLEGLSEAGDCISGQAAEFKNCVEAAAADNCNATAFNQCVTDFDNQPECPDITDEAFNAALDECIPPE